MVRNVLLVCPNIQHQQSRIHVSVYLDRRSTHTDLASSHMCALCWRPTMHTIGFNVLAENVHDSHFYTLGKYSRVRAGLGITSLFAVCVSVCVCVFLEY